VQSAATSHEDELSWARPHVTMVSNELKRSQPATDLKNQDKQPRARSRAAAATSAAAAPATATAAATTAATTATRGELLAEKRAFGQSQSQGSKAFEDTTSAELLDSHGCCCCCCVAAAAAAAAVLLLLLCCRCCE